RHGPSPHGPAQGHVDGRALHGTRAHPGRAGLQHHQGDQRPRDDDLRGRAEREHGPVDRPSGLRAPDRPDRAVRHRPEPPEQSADAGGLPGGALMGVALIDAVGLQQALPIEVAIDALEASFRASTLPTSPLRTHVQAEGADLLMMPAMGDPGIGIKLVTVNPSKPGRGLPLIHAVYVLFGPGSTEPLAVIDGAALTALRTAAVSALATRHRANLDAERLVIFGAGVQGHSHLLAMRAVRPIWLVKVVSRTPQRAGELIDRARALDMEASVGGPEAVAKADLVCTCTTSPEPLFDGAL